MSEDGEDDDKVMVSDVEVVQSGGNGAGGGGRVNGSADGGGVDDSSESSGVGDTGESLVYRSGGGGVNIVYRSVGGGLCWSGWYFGIGWDFHGRSAGRSGTGGAVCCEASPVLCKWKGIFFVLF